MQSCSLVCEVVLHHKLVLVIFPAGRASCQLTLVRIQFTDTMKNSSSQDFALLAADFTTEVCTSVGDFSLFSCQ